MSNSNPKDIIASINAKLLNISRKNNSDHQFTLTKYSIERFLYRVSISDYKEQFVLKGAQLFCLWTDTPHRPTHDLDFLKYGSPDIEEINTIFRELCSQNADTKDGIKFDPDSVKAESIRDDNAYAGVRIKLRTTLGNSIIPIQIDIGFGDVTVPPVKMMAFPSMLDMKKPMIKSYCMETTIAEKTHALIELGLENSRMKDIYDICKLIEEFSFDGETIKSAIKSTFDLRKTEIPTTTPIAFSPKFEDEKRTMWHVFLEKNDLKTRLKETKLNFVLKRVSDFVTPLFNAITENQKYSYTWFPKTKWVPNIKK
jgi:predicted nucleotidyltransferase component of viral defense system